jgi:hypothetical protein
MLLNSTLRRHSNGVVRKKVFLMKQPALRAVDGARFFGTIDSLDNGRMFRATCYAQIDHKSTEQPEIRMFASDDEAEQWIGQEARRRGFDAYSLTRRKDDTR